jgi:hypothetical protein
MSKFDKVFEARETDKQEKKDDAEQSKSSVKSPNKSKPAGKQTPVHQKAGSEKITFDADADTSRRRGRPPAKRSDPTYVGFTTYIRKDTHLKVKIALLQEGDGRELSELVEELLSKWANDK